MNRLTIAVFFLVTQFVAPAASADETIETLYQKGNQAYFAQDYEKASVHYRKLLELQPELPEILYNLGNCAYQLGSFGDATWYYRKAMQLSTGETAGRAERNLTLTRKALTAKYKKKLEKGILHYDESHGIWYALFHLLPLTFALILFLAFTIPLFAALFIWTYAKAPGRQLVARIIFLSLLIPTLVAGALYFGRVTMSEITSFGIVVAEDAQLLDAPDRDSPGIPVAEGLEVEVLLRNELDFFKVQMADGRIGYISDRHFRPL
jgi:hypothetical protein